MEDNKEKNAGEMTERPFGLTHIVLLCVAIGLLGVALVYSAERCIFAV